MNDRILHANSADVIMQKLTLVDLHKLHLTQNDSLVYDAGLHTNDPDLSELSLVGIIVHQTNRSSPLGNDNFLVSQPRI